MVTAFVMVRDEMGENPTMKKVDLVEANGINVMQSGDLVVLAPHPRIPDQSKVYKLYCAGSWESAHVESTRVVKLAGMN